MDIVINDGSFFRKLVSCIKELTNLTEFTFDQRGISVQAMDDAHVCLIDILLPADSFEKFVVSRPINLGFNFENFNNILKLSKNSSIGISYKEGNDKILINVSEHIHKKIEFEMTLTDIVQEGVQINELEHQFKVYIDTDEFQKSIKDLSAFGDKCTIIVNADSITFKVTGKAGTGKICIDDAEIELDDETDEIKQTFATKYLALFAKANLSDQVSLKFSKTTPFCCEYTVDDGHVCFYLGQIEL
jgi:proliferating cell nuclear antigen